MDRKTFNKPRPQKKKSGPKQGFASIPRNIPTDTLVVRSSRTEAALSSGTDGTVSASISATIALTSEYSNFSSLYREVKLMAQAVQFFFYYPYVNSGSTSNVTTTWCLGTDMRMNATTYTPPTQYLDVYNTADRRLFARTNPQLITFKRRVPRNLEFTNIADDSPTLPIPYAGCPGVVQVYSTGNVPSVQQTTIIMVTTTYMLKGRI